MAYSINVILNLFYPPLCLHCQVLLPKRQMLFCSARKEILSLIHPQGHCRTCFAEFDHGKCERCMKRTVVIHRQLAACEPIGPAKALLNGIDCGKQECIPAAASLMAYQWLEYKMPLPDLLIPLPSSFWKKQKIGFNPHRMLAEEIGKIFSVPVRSILHRKFDRASFLTQGQFRWSIQCLKKEKLCDSNILLIASSLDDTLFRSVGKELRLFFPAHIGALAFASSFHEK